VHEVAYGRLEKEQRLVWHRVLAEREASRAFHSEAAVKLLRDLRPHDPELSRLASFAASALLEEGTLALRQRDVPAAIGLLARSLNLVPDEAVTAIRLSDALLLSGETQAALEVVSGNESGACLAQRGLIAVRLGEAAADHLDLDPADGLARCRWEQVRMLTHLAEGRFGAAEEAVAAALGHARGIGDVYEEERLVVAECEVRQWSPTPMAAKLAGCRALAKRFASDRFLLVPVLVAQSRCLAFMGDRDGARMALAEAGAAVEQLRLTMGRVLIAQACGLARSIEGEHAEAEWHFRRAATALDDAGHRRTALTMHVLAARERLRQDPSADAGLPALLERLDEMDLQGRLLCLSARPSSVEEVLALLETTDDPCLRGEVYFDLARAHRALGDEAAAMSCADAALACYTAAGASRPMWTVQRWK
jgi:tetratricopeptide (TPR) repeat protein